MHAAQTWKYANTRVTGLDLIDVHLNQAGEVSSRYEAESVPKNVTWIRSNLYVVSLFALSLHCLTIGNASSVKYALPFPDETFDLVRMANLALCIPLERWGFVLAEVERVLKAGGRLELIDDALFFPPIISPLASSRNMPSCKSKYPYSDSDDDTVIGIGLLPESSSRRSTRRRPTHSRTPSASEFIANTAAASHLETTFNNMLSESFQISPRPHVFIDQILDTVFGSGQTTESHVFHLAVPSRQLFEQQKTLAGDGPTGGPNSGDSRETVNTGRQVDVLWDCKVLTSEPEALEDDDDPFDKTFISPKAARLLIGDEKTRSSRMGVPFQPPGLVLLPSTLIEFSPSELEMHACRNMNVLLGCKHALINYMTECEANNDSLTLQERACEDIIWEYER